MKRSFAAAAVALLLLAACSKSGSTGTTSSSTASPTPEAITIAMTEFAFEMPDEIPAGVQTLHIENVGGMPHFIEFQGITGDNTDEDIQAFMDDPKNLNGPPPAWATKSNITNVGLMSPGASTDVTIDLPPGRYAAFCWMPDAQGKEHALLGMHHVFTVTGEATGTLPTPDFTLTWNGSKLEGVPATIPTGTQTIGYENTGSKPADITAVRVLEDVPTEQLLKDVDAWFGGLYAGPAPVEFLGGLSVKPGGGVIGTSTIDFADGVYGFAGPGKAEPVLVTVGSGGFPSPAASMAPMSCTPDGSALSIAAASVAFSTDCLAAPAGQAFTIAFDNQDAATSHNVGIYPEAADSKAVFSGQITVGPTTVIYDVGALDAGTYRFQCDVHPTTMYGTFIVG